MNYEFQFYKGIKLKLIDRKYAAKKAKRFYVERYKSKCLDSK
ncbi:MAG TPA: hypothetical protein VIH12_01890 [Solibacillus sp.]